MLTKLNLRSRLFACVAGAVPLVLLLGGAGLAAITSARDLFNSTADGPVRKLELADAMLLDSAEMVSAQSGVVLGAFEKNSSQIESSRISFQRNTDAIQKTLEEIRPLLVTEDGRVLLSDISGKLSEWQPLFDEIVRQSIAGNAEQAARAAVDLTVPVYTRLRQSATRLGAQQTDFLDANRIALKDQESRRRWIMLVLFVLCLVANGLIAFVVFSATGELRGALSEITEGVNQVSGAAKQVATGSQALAQGSSKQAASIEETSASTEEINSMARKNSQSSRSAAELVSRSQQQFSNTNRSLQEMVIAMSEITAGSDKISKIIKVIDEIAFQTNILALNAAVEAARAGEAGMGFAVVADEVRNLAQRSAQAAKDTASLIEDSIAKSNGGKVKVDEVAAAIHAITEEFSGIKMLVDEISLGSQEQAKGTDQIGRVITQMEQATQRNAAGAEESAAVAEELTAQANSLKEVVGRLADMVGRNRLSVVFAKPAPINVELAVKTPFRPPLPSSPAAPVTAGKSEFPLDDDFKEF